MNAPMVDSPFWAWLEVNLFSTFSVAIERYLGYHLTSRVQIRGQFTEDEQTCYRYIHQHFWFRRLKGHPK